MKIMVVLYPFTASIESLHDHDVIYNDLDRKYTRDEVLERFKEHNPDIVIAGSEKYDAEALDVCSNLKMISRVGIGVDSVDLNECRKRGIVVTNTPDAPTNSVAELVIGQMLNMARNIQWSDSNVRDGKWIRHFGFDIKGQTIGILGAGRIGYSIIEKLRGFDCRILVNDIVDRNVKKCEKIGAIGASKDHIIKRSKILSIHVPLCDETIDYISGRELALMSNDSCIINTSRGGIINEQALYNWLVENPLASAAIDVFEKEPYDGNLTHLKNCYLTSHIASSTRSCRNIMESESILSIVDFIDGSSQRNWV